MRPRYQILSLGGLFFLLLFLAWLRFFSGRQVFPDERVVSPTPLGGAAKVLGKAVNRFSPFGYLLQSWAGPDKVNPARNEDSGGGTGKDVGGEGLLSLFLKTVADDARRTAAPAATVTPTPSAAPEVLGDAITPTPALTVDQQQIKEQVDLWGGYLAAGNYTALYQLMSQEFRQNFPLVAFQNGLAGGPTLSSLELAEAPQVGADWAEAVVKATPVSGPAATYKAVFHRENGNWYLFGTE